MFLLSTVAVLLASLAVGFLFSGWKTCNKCGCAPCVTASDFFGSTIAYTPTLVLSLSGFTNGSCTTCSSQLNGSFSINCQNPPTCTCSASGGFDYVVYTGTTFGGNCTIINLQVTIKYNWETKERQIVVEMSTTTPSCSVVAGTRVETGAAGPWDCAAFSALSIPYTAGVGCGGNCTWTGLSLSLTTF